MSLTSDNVNNTNDISDLEKCFKRLSDLEYETENLSIDFAKKVLPSAIATYGRPLIGASEEEDYKQTVCFEWRNMIWIFEKDGLQMKVLIDHNDNFVCFNNNDLALFIQNHNFIPAGLPEKGNQSEFQSINL